VAKTKRDFSATAQDLVDLETDTLRARWAKLFGVAPGPRISPDMLIRGVAFAMQEEVDGGLSKSCQRQLRRLAQTLRSGGSITEPAGAPSFKPGTRLIREWQGRVHEVVIAGDTYIWSGKPYRSLSQIARAITGTRWSGPRFFGLETGKNARKTPASPDVAEQATRGNLKALGSRK
jgi:hypothetical protein